uniref:DUF3019 domain-containing protein n=1 Tax=Strongyloides stercoralis TaxID=6248 RepID=A0A0K0EK69_STRER
MQFLNMAFTNANYAEIKNPLHPVMNNCKTIFYSDENKTRDYLQNNKIIWSLTISDCSENTMKSLTFTKCNEETKKLILDNTTKQLKVTQEVDMFDRSTQILTLNNSFTPF